MRTFVAYVPVLHEGYRRFFESEKGPKELYIFGPDIVKEFDWLRKEIRELNPALMQKAIASLRIFKKVTVLDTKNIQKLNTPKHNLLLPDEDITRSLAKKYFPKAKKKFSPIFLRWDKHNSVKEKPVVPDEKITKEKFHRAILKQAEKESQKSSDIWRHVGAAIVKNGKVVLTAYNQHVPSAHTPWVHGDPRNNFHKGDHIEISSAFHAEASLIATATRRGLTLAGADMYVTVFPCPPCAKLIAYSGIKNLYCGGGYAVLDGEAILKSQGVKIFFVE